MALYHVCDYEQVNVMDFEQLPKGYVLEMSMNPYTGYVFLQFEKHPLSSRIGLDVMRRIVKACDLIESKGYDDALRVYAHMAQT